VPGVIVHHHFDEHITREKATLGSLALPILHFHHFFSGHQNAAELLLHTGTRNAFLDVALHRLLHTRIGMNDVPAQIWIHRNIHRRLHTIRVHGIHHHFLQPKIKSYRTHSKALSVNQRNSAITTTKANT